MAKLDSEFSFTGRLGELSAYKRRDMDKTILRKKGGATKEKIKKDRAFDIVRRNNAEFGGRGTATKYIRNAIWPLKALADYNFTPVLNGLLKAIQVQDTESKFGKRNIILSANPQLLNGFNLNRRVVFDSIIRNPLTITVSKEKLSAVIDIPALLPGINFFASSQYPVYSIIACLGLVPDLVYTAHGYAPKEKIRDQLPLVHAATAWLPVMNDSPAASLTLQLPVGTSANHCSMVLGAGIRFGNLIAVDKIEQAQYAGAAKILGVV